MSYRHTPEMGEISGFGGGYEKTCQDMLEAGVEWMLEHPEFEFSAEGYQGAVGLVYANNEETQELMHVIVNASKNKDGAPEADGAQIHGIMQRLGFIANNGWHAYVAQCRAGPKKVVQ